MQINKPAQLEKMTKQTVLLVCDWIWGEKKFDWCFIVIFAVVINTQRFVKKVCVCV